MERLAKLAKLVDITKGRTLLLKHIVLPEHELGLGVIKVALDAGRQTWVSKV